MSVRIVITLAAILLFVVFPSRSPAAGTGSSGGGGTVVVDGVIMDTLWPLRATSLDRLVPLADFARSTGALYSFYPGTGGAVIARGDRVLEIYMDRQRAVINGSEVILKQPPVMVDGVIYIPLGTAASALGYTVTHEQASNIIYLSRRTAGESTHRNYPDAATALDLLPPGSEFIGAEGVNEGQTALKGDFELDGALEYAALYRKNDGKYGLILYKNENGRYSRIWLKEEDFPPSLINITDLNGGGPELLVGWSLGDPLGSYLEVFTVKDGIPEILHSSLYHRIDLGDFDGDGSGELAVWQQDTGETYLTSVLKWDGRAFTKQEYHPHYYARVIEYYRGMTSDSAQKRAVQLYLAEAFLRSGDFRQALEAAEEGLRQSQGNIDNNSFYGLKGLALEGLERYQEALPYLKKSLEGRPGPVWPESRFALSRCYLKTGAADRGRLELVRSINEGNHWQGFERAREFMKAELK